MASPPAPTAAKVILLIPAPCRFWRVPVRKLIIRGRCRHLSPSASFLACCGIQNDGDNYRVRPPFDARERVLVNWTNAHVGAAHTAQVY